jgi:predicted DNA-binding protein (MmcQ/YjbR family)
MKERPRRVRLPEEMKAWCASLEAELLTWPEVAAKLMFGMKVFYRKRVIFAALPRTLGFETPYSVAFKLHQKTPRLARSLASAPGIVKPDDASTAKWISFELSSTESLRAALQWFERAYNSVPQRTKRKRKTSGRKTTK